MMTRLCVCVVVSLVCAPAIVEAGKIYPAKDTASSGKGKTLHPHIPATIVIHEEDFQDVANLDENHGSVIQNAEGGSTKTQDITNRVVDELFNNISERYLAGELDNLGFDALIQKMQEFKKTVDSDAVQIKVQEVMTQKMEAQQAGSPGQTQKSCDEMRGNPTCYCVGTDSKQAADCECKDVRGHCTAVWSKTNPCPGGVKSDGCNGAD